MKSILKIAFLSIFFFLASFQSSAQSSKYKCMLQMSNYMGAGAYVVVSLVSDKGAYVKSQPILALRLALLLQEVIEVLLLLKLKILKLIVAINCDLKLRLKIKSTMLLM